MIKAEELRIGAWVTYGRTGENYKIDAIWKDLYWLSDGSHVSHQNSNIDGIPLTPEILEKSGWNHTHTLYTGTMVFSGHPILYFKDGIVSISIKTAEIKYIHQLQNLYFALTNTELEIKL